MGDHYDVAETQDPARREEDLFHRLRAHLRDALASTPALRSQLGGIDPESIGDRKGLAALPVLRKADLMAMQAKSPPFGGWLPEGAMPPRVFVSPGPVYEPQLSGADPYSSARALHAAGFRAGDTIANCFGYHVTPGGFILDEGARALGCTIYPAGPGNSQALAGALAAFGPKGYVGTPDFLRTVLDQAADDGHDLSSITHALVSGGALFPAMREDYAARGVRVMQAFATADLGVIAYESEHEGTVLPGMIVNEGVIVEIVTPGTGDPVTPGEVGEIVVTPLTPDWPLVRFATGDMTKALDGMSPCGRTNMRIAGWMGRADQRTKVRGMFVDPAQVAALVKRMPEIARARLVVGRDAEGTGDTMLLKVEPAGGSVDAGKIEAAMKEAFGLRGEVRLEDELPRDGVLVEDARDYSKG